MSQNSNCGCDCSNKPNHTKCRCKSYFYAAKNPFDVGIAKEMGDGEYLVLLSGNRHGTTDFDGDQLPDWIGIGERPCRHYRTLTTEELVSLWKDPSKGYDDCMRRTTFRQVHPNGYFNFYTTDGLNRSTMVEITDAKIEVATTGESTLCVMVRIANNDDDRLVLDGLDSHMFRVNLSVNPVRAPKNHRNGHRMERKVDIVMPSPPPAPVFNNAPTVTMGHQAAGQQHSDSSKMMGPTNVTTQSNQQTAQQQLAQQQQMGSGKEDKKKHDKKKKKKCLKKCEDKKGKKKKKCKHECNKKGQHKKGHKSDRDTEEHDSVQKKKT